MRRKRVLYMQVYSDNGRWCKTVCTAEVLFAQPLNLITLVISIIIEFLFFIIISIPVLNKMRSSNSSSMRATIKAIEFRRTKKQDA
jgi:hypothetical protein